MDVKANFNHYLSTVIKLNGQDLFLKVGSVPRARVGGSVVTLPFDQIEEKDTRAMVDAFLNPKQRELLEKHRSVDFAFSFSDNGQRFRGNAFYAQGVYSLVVRRLWNRVPTFEELHIPSVLKDVALRQSGIVLVAGTVGSGKTTTINAMIDFMNHRTHRHIVTIEDPVEYLHEDKTCMISQREIGQDASDFDSALKYVVRQSPDVIVIGEMRDAETFSFALSASEVGRLVISTIHAKSVVQILERVLSFFPPERRDAVLNHLSYHVTCFMVEKLLVKSEDKSLLPAFEILVGTSITRQLIREKEFEKIPQALRNGVRDGMMTMDQSILALWKAGEISNEEALCASARPMELEKLMKGIHVETEGSKILGQ